MFKVFRTRKMGSILILGISSGLPLYLTSRTLQAWMTVAGVDLSAIGLFSMVGLPYSLKFLWSPLIDHFSFPFLGRRKGWVLTTQLAIALATAGMALQRPGHALEFLALNAIVLAFFSATQDVVIDAYATDICAPAETGAASGVKVLGYRIAMIVTGAGALVAADVLSWPAVYFTFSLIMLMLAAVSSRVPEPVVNQRPPYSLREAAVMPMLDFFGRLGRNRGIAILAFVVVYRLGDAMVNNMATPFLLRTGFSQTDIGIVQGGIGIFATIVGVLAGGAVIVRIGINRSLWVFGGLQAASNFAYLLLAQAGSNFALMVITVIVENVCYGLATAALVGFIMSICNPQFSATQYALLSSLIAVGRDVVAAPSGLVAEHLGWPGFFWLSIVASLPGMLLLPRFAPWTGGIGEGIDREMGTGAPV
jgi:MFS transporter, PAT family, beta-lactamase induction signal transducer AmpG